MERINTDMGEHKYRDLDEVEVSLEKSKANKNNHKVRLY